MRLQEEFILGRLAQNCCSRKKSKIQQNRHTGESRYPGSRIGTKHWTPVFTGVTTFYDFIKIGL
jgi:hypothetical protein